MRKFIRPPSKRDKMWAWIAAGLGAYWLYTSSRKKQAAAAVAVAQTPLISDSNKIAS